MTFQDDNDSSDSDDSDDMPVVAIDQLLAVRPHIVNHKRELPRSPTRRSGQQQQQPTTGLLVGSAEPLFDLDEHDPILFQQQQPSSAPQRDNHNRNETNHHGTTRPIQPVRNSNDIPTNDETSHAKHKANGSLPAHRTTVTAIHSATTTTTTSDTPVRTNTTNVQPMREYCEMNGSKQNNTPRHISTTIPRIDATTTKASTTVLQPTNAKNTETAPTTATLATTDEPMKTSQQQLNDDRDMSHALLETGDTMDMTVSVLDFLLESDETQEVASNNMPKKAPQQPRTRRKKKPVDMPRKPHSAYNLFFAEERRRMAHEMEASGEASKGTSEDNRTVGKRWKALDADRRKYYQDLADEDKKRQNAAMEEYLAAKKKLETDLEGKAIALQASGTLDPKKTTLVDSNGEKRGIALNMAASAVRRESPGGSDMDISVDDDSPRKQALDAAAFAPQRESLEGSDMDISVNSPSPSRNVAAVETDNMQRAFEERKNSSSSNNDGSREGAKRVLPGPSGAIAKNVPAQYVDSAVSMEANRSRDNSTEANRTSASTGGIVARTVGGPSTNASSERTKNKNGKTRLSGTDRMLDTTDVPFLVASPATDSTSSTEKITLDAAGEAEYLFELNEKISQAEEAEFLRNIEASIVKAEQAEKKTEAATKKATVAIHNRGRHSACTGQTRVVRHLPRRLPTQKREVLTRESVQKLLGAVGAKFPKTESPRVSIQVLTTDPNTWELCVFGETEIVRFFLMELDIIVQNALLTCARAVFRSEGSLLEVDVDKKSLGARSTRFEDVDKKEHALLFACHEGKQLHLLLGLGQNSSNYVLLESLLGEYCENIGAYKEKIKGRESYVIRIWVDKYVDLSLVDKSRVRIIKPSPRAILAYATDTNARGHESSTSVEHKQSASAVEGRKKNRRSSLSTIGQSTSSATTPTLEHIDKKRKTVLEKETGASSALKSQSAVAINSKKHQALVGNEKSRGKGPQSLAITSEKNIDNDGTAHSVLVELRLNTLHEIGGTIKLASTGSKKSIQLVNSKSGSQLERLVGPNAAASTAQVVSFNDLPVASVAEFKRLKEGSQGYYLLRLLYPPNTDLSGMDKVHATILSYDGNPAASSTIVPPIHGTAQTEKSNPRKRGIEHVPVDAASPPKKEAKTCAASLASIVDKVATIPEKRVTQEPSSGYSRGNPACSSEATRKPSSENQKIVSSGTQIVPSTERADASRVTVQPDGLPTAARGLLSKTDRNLRRKRVRFSGNDEVREFVPTNPAVFSETEETRTLASSSPAQALSSEPGAPAITKDIRCKSRKELENILMERTPAEMWIALKQSNPSDFLTEDFLNEMRKLVKQKISTSVDPKNFDRKDKLLKIFITSLGIMRQAPKMKFWGRFMIRFLGVELVDLPPGVSARFCADETLVSGKVLFLSEGRQERLQPILPSNIRLVSGSFGKFHAIFTRSREPHHVNFNSAIPESRQLSISLTIEGGANLGTILIPLDELDRTCSHDGSERELSFRASPGGSVRGLTLKVSVARRDDRSYVRDKSKALSRKAKELVDWIKRYNSDNFATSSTDGSSVTADIGRKAEMSLVHAAVLLHDTELLKSVLRDGRPSKKATVKALDLARNMAEGRTRETQALQDGAALEGIEGDKRQGANLESAGKSAGDQVGTMMTMLQRYLSDPSIDGSESYRSASFEEGNTIEKRAEASNNEDNLRYELPWLSDTDWLTKKKNNVCREWKITGSCPRKGCRFVHVHRHGTHPEVRFDFSPSSIHVLSQKDSHGEVWYSAGYSNEGNEKKDFKLVFYAQGGRGEHISKQNVSWYDSESAARAALERTSRAYPGLPSAFPRQPARRGSPQLALVSSYSSLGQEERNSPEQWKNQSSPLSAAKLLHDFPTVNVPSLESDWLRERKKACKFFRKGCFHGPKCEYCHFWDAERSVFGGGIEEPGRLQEIDVEKSILFEHTIDKVSRMSLVTGKFKDSNNVWYFSQGLAGGYWDPVNRLWWFRTSGEAMKSIHLAIQLSRTR